ncbi:MAG: hypothetical protein ABFS45_09650 [Pseudomonadota bacterium]
MTENKGFRTQLPSQLQEDRLLQAFLEKEGVRTEDLPDVIPLALHHAGDAVVSPKELVIKCAI